MAPYTGNSIVDYLKSTGAASDFASRTALAGKSGIKNYSGTAEQNTTLLNTLNSSATNPRDAFVANNAGTSSSGSGTPTGTNNNGGTPAVTPTDPFSTYRDYLSKYGESLTETPDITKSRTDLADIQNEIDTRTLEGRREYEAKLDESGGLRAGAQASATLARRRSNSELADLAVREGGAARTLDALNTGLNAKQTYLKTRAELAKPVQIGDKYYDPTTGKEIPSSKAKAGFELSAGQSRYEINPETGQYEKIASVAAAPSTAGVTRSGGLTYTPSAAAEDSQALEQSRGDDGYVDPSLYQQLYKAWVASGGLLKDFLTTYPPKNYVNPANTNLPNFLMPKETGVVNPYE